MEKWVRLQTIAQPSILLGGSPFNRALGLSFFARDSSYRLSFAGFRLRSSLSKIVSSNNYTTDETKRMEEVTKMSKKLLGDFWKNKSLAKGLSLKQPESTGNWKDIEIYKPSSTTLSVEEYDKLFKRIRNGFVLQQLQEYVKNHNNGRVVEQHVKGTKSILIKHIINNIWKLSTFSSEIVRSKPIDIFFILGPEGESLKWLEAQANVKIGIDLNTFSYKISGLEKDIRKVKEFIAKLTSYTSITVDLPPNIKDEDKTLQEMMPYIQDICRSSGSFIELGQKNQIVIYGQTQQNIKKAQRLLDIAWEKPDENENHLVICSNKQESSEYCFLPVHDVVTLPVYHRNMHWHRLDPISTMYRI